MLAEKYSNLNLAEILLPHGVYKPFPQADDRPFWQGLPEDMREQLIFAGEKLAGYEWPNLPAALYMENKRNGNRSRYEAACFGRRSALGALALAECAEGKGRFLGDIVNGIWCVCEESSWCIPAHMPSILPDTNNPNIDLFAAETASMLAWVHYLLQPALDAVSPLICPRMAHEVKTRVLGPYLVRDDFWWMGFVEHDGPMNNWNPWCHSNCLAAFLLMERDGGRREAAIRKCLVSLDRFLATYHADGGCDEGTSYWGHAGGALLDCLELLHGATGGAIDVYGELLIQNIGRFICRSHIAGDWYINFADGGARVKIPAELVWRYGKRIGDGALTAQGAAAFRVGGMACPATTFGSLFRPLWGIVNRQELLGDGATPPMLRDVWMEGIEVMAARQMNGSAEGLYLAAKGGHNGESHNHNDVGSFVVYTDGCPVIIDVGVETYTAKTFSDNRYDIWTMQSAYHNLPTVNGIQQRDGGEFRAKIVQYECREQEVSFSMDIADAYPKEAGIVSWKRCFTFGRQTQHIEIADEFELGRETSDIAFTFMTCCEHEIRKDEIIFNVLSEPSVILRFDGEAFAAATERIEIRDERLGPVWGDHVYRIVLKAMKCMKQGTVSVVLEQL